MTGHQRVRLTAIAAYSAPAIPMSALGLPLVVYLPHFYVQSVGLEAAAVGAVFMLMRFWDVLTDPLLGIASDRWKTRWGRRRHWIVLAVPILSVAAWMIFFPPEDAGIWHLIVWMFVLYIGWTLLTISHQAWGAELSPLYHDRSRIHGWREFSSILGLITVLALPAIVDAGFPDATQRDGVGAMGLFFLILLPATVLMAVFVTERETLNNGGLHWGEALAALRTNKPLRYVLLAEGLFGLATGLLGSLFLWFIGDIMQLDRWKSFILLCYFAAGLVAVPVWIELARRIGKHKTFSVAMFFGAVVLPFMAFFQPGDFWPVLAGHMVYGVAFGAGHFLAKSIMADVTDEDALATGEERTGLFYAIMAMAYKVGLALAVGISYPALSALGFEAGSATGYSDAVLAGFYGLYLYLPSALMIVAGFVMWRFPLDVERQKELRAGLESRAGQDMTGGA